MEMSEEVPAKTSYGRTEKFTTVPSTNISVHTDYSRTISSTNISECTTVPNDGPSKKKKKKKKSRQIRRKDLKVYMRQNFIKMNSKGKSHVKCAHN